MLVLGGGSAIMGTVPVTLHWPSREFTRISGPNMSNLGIVTQSLCPLCPCVVQTILRL